MARSSWLEDIHRRAGAMIAEHGFEARFRSFLRDDQIGQWKLDGISGYYWYLHALVAVTKPKKVLELGRCLGTSTLFMLGALEPQSVLITVDIEERASNLAHCADDPRLKVVTGNDLDLSTYGDIDVSGIDFLFIDTDHTYAQATPQIMPCVVMKFVAIVWVSFIHIPKPPRSSSLVEGVSRQNVGGIYGLFWHLESPMTMWAHVLCDGSCLKFFAVEGGAHDFLHSWLPVIAAVPCGIVCTKLLLTCFE